MVKLTGDSCCRLTTDEPELPMTTVYKLVGGSLQSSDESAVEADTPAARNLPSSAASVARLCDWSSVTPFRASPKTYATSAPSFAHLPRQRATSASGSRPGSSKTRNVREMLARASWSSACMEPRGLVNWHGRMFLTSKTGMTKGEREIVSGICQNREGLRARSRADVDRLLRLHGVASHADAWLMGKQPPYAENLNLNDNAQEEARLHLRPRPNPPEERILSARPSLASPRFMQERPGLVCKRCMTSSRPSTKHGSGYQHIGTIIAPPSSPVGLLEAAPCRLWNGANVSVASQDDGNDVLESDCQENSEMAKDDDGEAAAELTESKSRTSEVSDAELQSPTPSSAEAGPCLVTPKSTSTRVASLRLTHVPVRHQARLNETSSRTRPNPGTERSGRGYDAQQEDLEECSTVFSEIHDLKSPDLLERKPGKILLNIYLPQLPGFSSVESDDVSDDGVDDVDEESHFSRENSQSLDNKSRRAYNNSHSRPTLRSCVSNPVGR